MDFVNCKKHGKNELVLSCQHVADGYISEIFLVPSDGNNEATIWCPTCEAARIKDKGWFDYADRIASWKVICSTCLDEIVRESNHCHRFEGARTPDE